MQSRNFYPKRNGDIIEVVNYAFKHTRDSDIENLRLVVTDSVIHVF